MTRFTRILLSAPPLVLATAQAAASSHPADERSSSFVAGAAQLSELFTHGESLLLGGMASAAIIGIFAFAIAGAMAGHKCKASLESIQTRVGDTGETDE